MARCQWVVNSNRCGVRSPQGGARGRGRFGCLSRMAMDSPSIHEFGRDPAAVIGGAACRSVGPPIVRRMVSIDTLKRIPGHLAGSERSHLDGAGNVRRTRF
jgi:hypothetical protein